MFKRIIAIVLLIACISGCGFYGRKANKGYEDGYSPIGYPNITTYGNDKFLYVVDENTNVVYLVYNGMYQYGMSVMFDENGNVITVDKLRERNKLYDSE